MSSSRNPAPVRRPPVSSASQGPGGPNRFERAALAAGLPIARPANAPRNPLQGGRRKTRRRKTIKRYTKKGRTNRHRMKGGDPAEASREGAPPDHMDLYVMLARSPTEETLREVADGFDQLTDRRYRGELVAKARSIRERLGRAGVNIPELVEEVKEFLSARHILGDEKEMVRARGVEISDANMWVAP